MNTKILLITAMIAMLTIAQGCTLKPQHLLIDPEIRVQDTQIGNGKTVGLLVTDARQDKKLGEVGDPDRTMVDVRVDEDPSPAIYRRLKSALMRQGFLVEPYREGMDRRLEVTVASLALQSQKTALTFETELRAEISAHAVNADAFYDRQFNVRTRKNGAVPPYEKDSTVLVNTAVSQAMEDLLADEQLLDLLAR